MVTSAEVLQFWFQEITPQEWFGKSDDFDTLLSNRFGKTLAAAKAGECYLWRTTAQGRVAEIIVLDQFSRNIYRNTPTSFAQDAMALALSQELLNHPDWHSLSIDEQKFALMPFMHSESLAIHQLALQHFQALGDENTLNYEKMHLAIIERFGRYPHRNAILSRDSSAEEMAFLQEPNSSF